MSIAVALWWVPSGHRPTPAEVRQKLEYLEQHGPTYLAFSFAQPFELQPFEITQPTPTV